jgi:hypothetical protein
MQDGTADGEVERSENEENEENAGGNFLKEVLPLTPFKNFE